MKKLLLAIAVTGMFATAAQAQNANKQGQAQTAETPEQKAEQQTKKATQQLGLSAEQQAKFKTFELERINTIAPLKQKLQSTTDNSQKQAIHAQIKTAREKFFNDVNGILNADQQTKWAEHKKRMQQSQGGEHQE